MEDNYNELVKSMETAKTFRIWFQNNLKDYAEDIAAHGADSGFPYITYPSDTAQLFDKYGAEIWQMAVEEADGLGYKNVTAMITYFSRSDMVDDLYRFQTLMVWFACETIANEAEQELEE
jgi:hypothetical protein